MISLVVSGVLVVVFKRPIGSILQRIMADEISVAWRALPRFRHPGDRHLQRRSDLGTLEKYISPMGTGKDAQILALTTDRWVLEVYRTVIGAMQGVAWMLLVFFIFALIAFVVVRAMELGRTRKSKRVNLVFSPLRHEEHREDAFVIDHLTFFIGHFGLLVIVDCLYFNGYLEKSSFMLWMGSGIWDPGSGRTSDFGRRISGLAVRVSRFDSSRLSDASRLTSPVSRLPIHHPKLPMTIDQ